MDRDVRHCPKVRHVVLISDIHGTLEALLQTLLQLGIARERTRGERKCLEWARHRVAVVILGDATNRTRLDRRKGKVGCDLELKDEELMIFAFIYHLNHTHRHYDNPIEYVLGNHCYNNLLGRHVPEPYASDACHEYMARKYETSRVRAMAARANLPTTMKGRRLFFQLVNGFSRAELEKHAASVVERRRWPRLPLFFRDFYRAQAATCFPHFGLVGMHGGPAWMLRSGALTVDTMEEWCKSMTHEAQRSIEENVASGLVDTILNDQTYSRARGCGDIDLNGISVLALGHVKPSVPVLRCSGGTRVSVDLGMNAYSGFLDDLDVRCVVLRRPGAAPLIAKRRPHTATCTHGKLQWKCRSCRTDPAWWTERDFL